MSTTPPIQYAGPAIESSVPFEIRRHLQLLYQKLGNHTQAFAIQQQNIDKLKAGSTTTVVEGVGGGGGSASPSTPSVGTVDNETGNTSVTTLPGDYGALVVLNDASPIAVTLSAAAPPWFCWFMNQGTGTATLTPAAPPSGSSTISYNGNPAASSMPLLAGYGCLVAYDGTNWWAWTEPVVPVTFTAITHEFLTAYNAVTGLFSAAQPAFSDISGTASAGQIPALSALSGAITASQLPANAPVVSFGSGAPSGSSAEGYLYFDTSVSPYNEYVYHSGAWHQVA